MTKVRIGDIVTFKAVVTDVEKFDDSQQIQAKILPNGEALGWCLQHENAFEVAEAVLKVGDRARWTQRSTHNEDYEILLVTKDGQATVKKVGNWNIEIAQTKDLRRI